MTRRLRLTGTAILIAGILLWRWYQRPDVTPRPAPTSATVPAAAPAAEVQDIATAARAEARGVRVTGTGVVVRLLPEDQEGARHQRFILRTPDGNTVIVAHNIDIAPRLEPLAVGDTVEFAGEYLWNARGGVLRWTHHDPEGRHQAGHLTVHGRTVD